MVVTWFYLQAISYAKKLGFCKPGDTVGLDCFEANLADGSTS